MTAKIIDFNSYRLNRKIVHLTPEFARQRPMVFIPHIPATFHTRPKDPTK